MRLPFDGRQRLTTLFGQKGSWKCGWHIGVDMVGDEDRRVRAIAPGVVESLNAHGRAYGNHVTLRHADGKRSLYAHLASVCVQRGQQVAAGQPLGMMGATGNAKGAHLHLEIHDGPYRYPAVPQAQADWLLDPCAILGIKPQLGVVQPAAAPQEPANAATVRPLTVRLLGQEAEVCAINHEGENYVRLRDIAPLLGWLVGWDDSAKQVLLYRE